MKNRVIAESQFKFDQYDFQVRVYAKPDRTSWFRVVGVARVDGKVRRIRREHVHGLYIARKEAIAIMQDWHGEL